MSEFVRSVYYARIPQIHRAFSRDADLADFADFFLSFEEASDRRDVGPFGRRRGSNTAERTASDWHQNTITLAVFRRYSIHAAVNRGPTVRLHREGESACSHESIRAIRTSHESDPRNPRNPRLVI